MWVPNELDMVEIEPELAIDAKVERTGTVVWQNPDAPWVTVELACLGYNPGGLHTKLLDVLIDQLKPA